MERKKIAFLDEGRIIGGAEKSLEVILKYLDRTKFQPVVIMSRKDKFYRMVDNLGGEIAVIKTPRFLSTSLEFGTRRIFNPFAIIYDLLVMAIKSLRLYLYFIDKDVNLVYTNTMFEHICGGIAAKMSRIPCVWHMHDIPSKTFLFGFGRIFINFFGLVLPAKIIAISKEVQEAFDEKIKRKIILVYHGIDLQKYREKDIEKCREIKRELGIKDFETVVGMVSRTVPWKGHRLFLQAAKIANDALFDVKFFIVGENAFGKDNYLQELKRLAEKLKIQDRVVFTGFIENVEDILGVIDVIVHCSLRPEPFGLTIIEAMACKKPVIAVDYGGPKEIIENGKDGVLIKPGSPVSLAKAIIDLVTSQKKRSEMQGLARFKVEERFDAKRYVRDLEGIYASLM